MGRTLMVEELKANIERAGKDLSEVQMAQIFTNQRTNHSGDYDPEKVTVLVNMDGGDTKLLESQLLPLLGFTYDSGYGGQELFGWVVFKDGTWLERGEYDGSEWWAYKEPPTFLPVEELTIW